MSAAATAPSASPEHDANLGISIEYLVASGGCPPGVKRTHYGKRLGYLFRSILHDLGRPAHQVAAELDPLFRIAVSDAATGEILALIWIGLTLDQVRYALARIDADGWRPGDHLL